MVAYDIEGGCKETSDVGSVSGITDSSYVSFGLATVVVGRVISCVGGCIGITLILQHADAGAISVGGVGVPFYAEVMMDVS